MLAYVIRRLLLLLPTLLGILVINFAVIQFAPGGPVAQALSELRGQAIDPTARLVGAGAETTRNTSGGEGDSIGRVLSSTGRLLPKLQLSARRLASNKLNNLVISGSYMLPVNG